MYDKSSGKSKPKTKTGDSFKYGSSEKEEAETRPRHIRSETDYDSYIENSDDMDERSKTETDQSSIGLKTKKITKIESCGGSHGFGFGKK